MAIDLMGGGGLLNPTAYECVLGYTNWNKDGDLHFVLITEYKFACDKTRQSGLAYTTLTGMI